MSRSPSKEWWSSGWGQFDSDGTKIDDRLSYVDEETGADCAISQPKIAALSNANVSCDTIWNTSKKMNPLIPPSFDLLGSNVIKWKKPNISCKSRRSGKILTSLNLPRSLRYIQTECLAVHLIVVHYSVVFGLLVF